jgi:hypothetical protein
VLIEAVERGVRGMIVISDNRHMAVRHRLATRAIHLESRTNDQFAAAVAGVHAYPAPTMPRRCAPRSKARMAMTARRWCMCRSIAGPTSWTGSAPGANGTGAQA